MTRLRFDQSYDPPAPVLPVRIGGIDEHDPGAMLRMLVDTGADCTLIPARLARSLKLPLVDRVSVQGVGGQVQSVPVHAASVRVGRLRVLVRVAAFSDEALLGRDILNRLIMQIDGPAQIISAQPRSKRAGR